MAASVDDLEALYRTRYGAFVRVAAAIAGGETRGADAVQDGFVRAITSRAAFRGEGTLEAWVWRIVVNSARATRRQGQSGTGPADTVEPHEPVWPGRGDGDPRGVHARLAALPERERMVVFLRYFADLDYRSIAKALDIEVGTVSATLHAAHTALRRSLMEANG
jgi:DNA-directed RNA polymerase specialized sigma24 family protein